MNSMWTLSLPLIFWATVVVQLLGAISLVAVRLCHNDRGRLVCQRLFLSALLALGLMTVLAVGAASDSWVTSGASLSLLTVCATMEFGGERSSSVPF